MGGSGKTQLALEFRRQAEEILNFMAVIWIDASSPVSIPHCNKRREKVLRETPDEWEYRKETVLSIFTTWELSFEQITGDGEERGKKDHFLKPAAFLDNTNISEMYFSAHFSRGRSERMDIFSPRAEWDSEKLGDILAELQKLSLLQMSDRQTSGLRFSFHPVVRDWIRLRKSNTMRQQFVMKWIMALTHYLEDVSNNNLPLETNQETILHIDSCVRNEREFLERSSNTGLDYYSKSAS